MGQGLRPAAPRRGASSPRPRRSGRGLPLPSSGSLPAWRGGVTTPLRSITPFYLLRLASQKDSEVVEGVQEKERRDVRTARLAQARQRRHGPLRDPARELGLTEEAAVSKPSLLQYSSCIRKFMLEEGLSDLGVPPEELDQKLVAHCDRLYLAGKDVSSGQKLRAAIDFFLSDYAHAGRLPLPRVSKALKGWRRLGPARTRQPLPWPVVCLIGQCLLKEFSPSHALYWITMVDTYLRPSEALRLRAEQILPPAQGHPRTVIYINPDYLQRPSKTGELNESVDISRQWVARCLVALRCRVSRGPLWCFDLRAARDAMEACVAKLRIQRLTPVLYSARHSGASLDRYLDRRSIEDVQQRGRWRTFTSVRRYEKKGMVQHAWGLLDGGCQSLCLAAERELPALLCARFGVSV